MSLILEALKKAERQHKLGEVPGISSQVSEQHGKGNGRLGWVMLALFAVVMLGLGLYLGGMQTAPQPRQASQVEQPKVEPPPAESRPVGELTARPVRPLPGNTTMPAPAPMPSGNLVQPVPVETQPLPPEAMETEVVAAKPPPPPEPRYEPPPEPPPPPAVPLHEMPSGFVSNLPAMNIDIHSYDSRPAKRYALINMEKYREGDYLAEGPLLIEILPDGVVMEHMGERFILPLGNL